MSAVVRAHYAPVFSRIGPYDRSLLDGAAWSDSAKARRGLVEYWAHEAALIPVADWPLMRWRMAEYRHGRWSGMRKVVERNPTLGKDILDVVTEVGAASAGEIERHLELDKPRPKGTWWNLSDTKISASNSSPRVNCPPRVASASPGTTTSPNEAVPADVLGREIGEEDAVRELIRRSSRALGIGTEADLRDYYRLARRQSAPAIADLVDAGELLPVDVDGWDAPAYLHPEAATPRRITGTALLCPFDPLIFFRPRTQRVFDFHYRIEIYTPEPKRVHGYYVFPLLVDGKLVGRVDLRAERATGRLLAARRVRRARLRHRRDGPGIARGAAGNGRLARTRRSRYRRPRRSRPAAVIATASTSPCRAIRRSGRAG